MRRRSERTEPTRALALPPRMTGFPAGPAESLPQDVATGKRYPSHVTLTEHAVLIPPAGSPPGAGRAPSLLAADRLHGRRARVLRARRRRLAHPGDHRHPVLRGRAGLPGPSQRPDPSLHQPHGAPALGEYPAEDPAADRQGPRSLGA